MDGRTREYLSGRFGDYYRSATLSLPPETERREWGHIPFTGGEGTTMIRHQSLLDLGDVADFLARTGPRHAYFSAAAYDDPGAGTMSEKGWGGADLVFDLDADHLPGVDEDGAAYAEMLAACKEALGNLLDLLRDDFGFERLRIVFSGGRGYHVHVRDPGVRELDSQARREIVDYVRAIDVDADDLVTTVSVEGTTRRQLRTDGGWGARVHDRLVSYVDALRETEESTAHDRLQELDGVGEGRAETVLGAVSRNPDAVRAGNVEVGGPGLRKLLDALATETFRAETAPIDEPVTTDLRRLIRLPGSLHGGSGLVVEPIDPDDVADFEPLVDAVPERFRGRRIMIDVTEPGPVPVGADSFTIGEGLKSVPEFAGVFLMARGRAEKAPE